MRVEQQQANFAKLERILSHRHDETALKIGASMEQIVESTRRQSEMTLLQTREASRDSRAMKLVAFVSLSFLPGSFVAVSFALTLNFPPPELTHPFSPFLVAIFLPAILTG